MKPARALLRVTALALALVFVACGNPASNSRTPTPASTPTEAPHVAVPEGLTLDDVYSHMKQALARDQVLEVKFEITKFETQGFPTPEAPRNTSGTYVSQLWIDGRNETSRRDEHSNSSDSPTSFARTLIVHDDTAFSMSDDSIP